MQIENKVVEIQKLKEKTSMLENKTSEAGFREQFTLNQQRVRDEEERRKFEEEERRKEILRKQKEDEIKKFDEEERKKESIAKHKKNIKPLGGNS